MTLHILAEKQLSTLYVVPTHFSIHVALFALITLLHVNLCPVCNSALKCIITCIPLCTELHLEMLSLTK
jgi:hypothetical protein